MCESKLRYVEFLGLNRSEKEINDLLGYLNTRKIDYKKLLYFLEIIRDEGPIHLGRITKELGYKETIDYKHIEYLRSTFLLRTNDRNGLIFMGLTYHGKNFLNTLNRIMGESK